MKVLIIGYGSIGKRHDEVLSTFVGIESIDIVTKQTLKSRVTFPSLEKVEVLEAYDYFIFSLPPFLSLFFYGSTLSATFNTSGMFTVLFPHFFAQRSCGSRTKVRLPVATSGNILSLVD